MTGIPAPERPAEGSDPEVARATGSASSADPHDDFMAYANEQIQEADDILDELRIEAAMRVSREATELLASFADAGRHLDPPSVNPEAARTAGEQKNESSHTDDNDDLDDPMSPEEVRNEFLRFRAWEKFKAPFKAFGGFLCTYFRSTTWPDVPACHLFCPETVVRDTVTDNSDLSSMPGGGVMLRCRC